MPACDEVKLLIGPFDDGELEPHEMEDVALHVVGCRTCKGVLDDYRSLGIALRDCLPQPPLHDFTSSVLKKIDQIPQPLWMRWKSRLGLFADHIGTAVSLATVGACAALLTFWLASPGIHQLAHHSSSAQIASNAPLGNANRTAVASQVNGATQLTGADEQNLANQPPSSMITLSSDPTTTVIWVPNQP